MRDEATQAKGSDRIEFANSLRGIAAVSVVIAHHVEAFWIGQPVVAVLTGMPALSFAPPWFATAFSALPLSFAAFGVGLFFVISGFVIPFSLVRYDARAFLTGRLLRIYPTYWVGFSVSVAAVLIGNVLVGGTPPFNAGQAALHYLPPLRAILYSKPIDGIIWTLEIELFFYLVCALLAGAIGRGDRRVGLAPFALFALWLPFYAFCGHPPAGLEKLAGRLEFIAVYLPFMIFMFTGVALNFRQRGLISRGLAGAWIAACVAMFMAAWATKFLGPGWAGLLVGVIEPESYLAALALFLAAMAAQDFFKAHPAFRFIADISYPLYVVHGLGGYVMLQLMAGRGVEPHLALGITLVAVFAAAWAIHHFVETPTHRYGQNLARGIMARKKARPIS
jgi:peptidoglycan/LPS O-acetylase OafA/YrhL